MGHSIMALPVPDEVLKARDAAKALDDNSVKQKHAVPDRDSH